MKKQLRYLVISSLMFSVLTAGCGLGKKETVTAKNNAKENKQKENEKRPNLMKRKTSKVVNMQTAMAENPKLFAVENKVKYKDPISGPLNAYVSMSSRINVMTFQHSINTMRAIEDRNLTYDEIMELIKSSKMTFNALPDNQMYAYDEKAGTFLILEDPDIKNSFHGEKTGEEKK